jgi:hypothetical protein
MKWLWPIADCYLHISHEVLKNDSATSVVTSFRPQFQSHNIPLRSSSNGTACSISLVAVSTSDRPTLSLPAAERHRLTNKSNEGTRYRSQGVRNTRELSSETNSIVFFIDSGV